MSAGAHESYVEYREVAPPSDRKFGVVVGSILAALSAWWWWRGDWGIAGPVCAAIGGALVAFGLLAPRLLGPLNRAWLKLGALMAAVVNPLVTLTMFALIFTPLAVLLRLKGRDVLQLRRAGDSYWRPPPDKRPVPQSLRDQF